MLKTTESKKIRRAFCGGGERGLNNLGRGSENNGKNRDKIFTRETAGIILVLFAALALAVLFTRDVIFGSVGFAISSFLLGVFGYCSVAALAALVYAGVVLITGKRLAVSGRTAGFCALFLVFLVCLVHTITAQAGGIEYGSYGEYLSACYAVGENSFFQSTGGGVIFGLIVYPVCKLTTSVGGYIIFSLLTVGAGYLVYASAAANRLDKRDAKKPADPAAYATGDTSSLYNLNYAEPAAPSDVSYGAQQNAYAEPAVQPQAAPGQPVQESGADRSKRLYSIGDEFDFKSRRELRQESRREEEERRARENAAPPMPSAYEQGRSILYPDRPAMQYPPQYTAPSPILNSSNDDGDYSWYNRNYAGGKAPSVTRSKSSSSSSSGSLYSSTGYTSNRIFDEKSYFNRPDRASSLAESYSKSFGGASSFSEGHELKSKRSAPATPQPEQAKQPEQEAPESADRSVQGATSYSQMYADETESNISYANRPRKIVTDATASEETSADTKPDYYRNDVAASAAENVSAVQPAAVPQPAQPAVAQQPAESAPVQPEIVRQPYAENAAVARQAPVEPVRGEAFAGRGAAAGELGNIYLQRGGAAVSGEESAAPAVDAGDIARRAGFGGSERTHMQPSAPREDLTSRGAQPALPPEQSVRGRDTAMPAEQPARPPLRGDRAEMPARRTEPVREETTDEDVFTRRDEEVSGEEPLSRGEEAFSRREEPRRTEEPRREEPRGEVSARPVRGMPVGEEKEQEEEKTNLRPISDTESAADLFDDEPEDSIVPEAMESARRGEPEEEPALPPRRDRAQRETPQEEPPRPKHIYAKYNPPPLSLLAEYPHSSGEGEDDDLNVDIIIQTLAQLKVPCEMKEITRGPSVTRYDIEIPGNIPTSRVLGYDRELAMRLHAKDGVNMQMHYETGSISIEVPRAKKETVGLRDMLLSPDFVNAKTGALAFGLGKNIEGRAVCGDIVKMTHLLVAGATNAGKSVCLHALLLSLLYKYSPEDLRLILVDPKQNEFIIYDKLPHLMINEIIAEPAKVVNVMNWLITEMERRYSLFQEKYKKTGTFVRTIDDFNANLTDEEEKLPKIVMVIDELADLMSAAKKDIEDRIQRLTQKSRAAGIHLVLATQRPSVDIITGVIKSNLPTRIALKVTQEVDSRTILDSSGAEKLLGQGDLLYKTASMTFPERVQGAFVSNGEMQNIINYVKEHNEAYFDDRVADYINNQKQGGGEFGGDADDSVEAVYIDALRAVVSAGQASISMIQRRCGVGYPKAGKIIEWMENMGYIATFNGSKARDVLITQEEFENKYGDYGE